MIIKNILLLFFLCWMISSQGQNSSKNNDQFTLEGKAISNLDIGADCGYFKLATVVEFQIINFSDKAYKNNRVGVVVPCPEFYGSNFFKKGATYILKVKILNEKTSKKDFDYTVQNMKTLEKYKNDNIYWPISITNKNK